MRLRFITNGEGRFKGFGLSYTTSITPGTVMSVVFFWGKVRNVSYKKIQKPKLILRIQSKEITLSGCWTLSNNESDHTETKRKRRKIKKRHETKQSRQS